MAAKDTASASGIGLGAAIAVTVSWSLYHCWYGRLCMAFSVGST